MLFELIESLRSELPEDCEANALEDDEELAGDDEGDYDEDESGDEGDEEEGETQPESTEVSGEGRESSNTERPHGLGPLSSDKDGATAPAAPTNPTHRFRSKTSLESLSTQPSKLIETPASCQQGLSGSQEDLLQDLMVQITLLEGGMDSREERPQERRHEAMVMMMGSPPKGMQALCDQAPKEPQGRVGLERFIGLPA